MQGFPPKKNFPQRPQRLLFAADSLPTRLQYLYTSSYKLGTPCAMLEMSLPLPLPPFTMVP